MPTGAVFVPKRFTPGAECGEAGQPGDPGLSQLAQAWGQSAAPWTAAAQEAFLGKEGTAGAAEMGRKRGGGRGGGPWAAALGSGAHDHIPGGFLPPGGSRSAPSLPGSRFPALQNGDEGEDDAPLAQPGGPCANE